MNIVIKVLAFVHNSTTCIKINFGLHSAVYGKVSLVGYVCVCRGDMFT